MSDIPIGSPPAPPGRHAAPRGWYPDPVDSSRERYWDGWGWSRTTRPSESAGPAAAGPSGFPQPAGPHGYGQPGPGQSGPGQGHDPSAPQPGQGWPGAPYGGPTAPQQYPGGAAASTAGPRTADGVPLAGWGWRALAAIIDLIIVTVLGSILSLPVTLQSLPEISEYFRETMQAAEAGRAAPRITADQLMTSNQQILVSAITVIVGIAYFAIFWRFRAATPGQLICGLRVVPADHGRNTERLSWTQVIIRAVVWSIPFTVGNVMLMLFGALNALFPLWNVRRQALHDLAAKTQLVRTR